MSVPFHFSLMPAPSRSRSTPRDSLLSITSGCYACWLMGQLLNFTLTKVNVSNGNDGEWTTRSLSVKSLKVWLKRQFHQQLLIRPLRRITL